MYNQTDEIRQDRTKLYFFYSMEELLEYSQEIKSKRKSLHKKILINT